MVSLKRLEQISKNFNHISESNLDLKVLEKYGGTLEKYIDEKYIESLQLEGYKYLIDLYCVRKKIETTLMFIENENERYNLRQCLLIEFQKMDKLNDQIKKEKRDRRDEKKIIVFTIVIIMFFILLFIVGLNF